jgi:nitrous oxide reductase accessory protein NosL
MANTVDRRTVLKTLGAGTLLGVTLGRSGSAAAADTDGTPLQFIPKTVPDANPLANELTKYPKCPYCGMDRTQFHHSRHLVQYEDDLVDGTCSIHCAALSLAINLDRGPKAIYAADFGSQDKVKPLIKVDGASYLIGSKLPGTMSKTSKLAFASADAAKPAQAENGGEIGDFHAALRRSYTDMAEDTVMIRKKRAERRQKMMEQQKG